MDHLFVGQIVHCKSFDDFEIFTDGFLAVQAGKIIKVGNRSELEQWQTVTPNFTTEITQLSATQFLIPGFIDCHIHAPQMPNLGIGLDMQLLDWLQDYTIPLESLYKDTNFAKNVYEKVVKRTIAGGTTLAAYYATYHKDSSMILAKEAMLQGQRAFIGKKANNLDSPINCLKTVQDALEDSKAFIKEIRDLKTDLVRPILTPDVPFRSDMTLMVEIAKLAKDNDLHIQTHISECIAEVNVTEGAFKTKYANIYDINGILTNKCMLGHGVYLDDSELQLLAERKSSIAHCPTSNTGLQSGMCNVKRIRSFGVRVGLGTDLSGGNKSSILFTIKDAIDVSRHLYSGKYQLRLDNGKLIDTPEAYDALNYKQAIYLATLGGAEALSVDQTVGNFVEGKDFDALLIEVATGAIDQFCETNLSSNKSADTLLLELVQKFVYVGDDRNIDKVYVCGRQVKI